MSTHPTVPRTRVFMQARIIANQLRRHTHPEEIVGLSTGAIDPATLTPHVVLEEAVPC